MPFLLTVFPCNCKMQQIFLHKTYMKGNTKQLKMGSELFEELKTLIVKSTMLERHGYHELVRAYSLSSHGGSNPLGKLRWDLMDTAPREEFLSLMERLHEKRCSKVVIDYAIQKALKELFL